MGYAFANFGYVSAMQVMTSVRAACVVFVAATAAVPAADFREVAAAHGGSLTSPLLRGDVVTRLRPTVEGMDRCSSFRVLNMTVVRFVDKHSPWIERWTVGDCGHVRPVTIEFTPTPDGGADFAVKMKR